MTDLKIVVAFDWWRSDNACINREHVDELTKAALTRITSQTNSGFVEGDLVETIDSIDFRGWWTKKERHAPVDGEASVSAEEYLQAKNDTNQCRGELMRVSVALDGSRRNEKVLREDNDRQAMVITEANDELRRLRQTTSQQAARIRVLERRMEAVKGSKFGEMFNEMMKKIEATGGEA